ncbi:MAG: hypothetical protein KAW84_08725 [Thermoplasmata archaeon]|nr:hypothetical protein [Thermoplasmata archaeon]
MKTDRNVIVRYASGMLGGQVVAKNWKGRPYLANRPSFPEDREFSEAQLTQQERFHDASAYSVGLIRRDAVPEKYEHEAKKARLTAYNIGIRDFLHAPKIREIDESNYTGKPGEEIVIRAVDDTEVIAVHVGLRKDGEIIEEGDAIMDEFNAHLWRYVTQTENEVPGTTIETLATDRPGNVTAAKVELL